MAVQSKVLTNEHGEMLRAAKRDLEQIRVEVQALNDDGLDMTERLNRIDVSLRIMDNLLQRYFTGG